MLLCDRPGQTALDKVIGTRNVPGQRKRIAAQARDLCFQQPTEMVHGSPALAFLGYPMPELNRPRPRVFKTKQPLPLGGIGNLDQHRGRARLSTPVGGRSRDIQFPNRRYSFTSQHPDGEFSSKDLARHGVRPGAASWQYLPLDREFGGLPLTTFDSADPMTPASSDCEIEFKLAAALCSVCHAAVRIDDEFVRDAGVESRVTLGCGIEADDLRIDDFA